LEANLLISLNKENNYEKIVLKKINNKLLENEIEIEASISKVEMGRNIS
jgi:hypothetical protein